MEAAYERDDLEAQRQEDDGRGRGPAEDAAASEDGFVEDEAIEVEDRENAVGAVGGKWTWKRRFACLVGTVLLAIGVFVLTVTLSTVAAEGRRWRSITSSMWNGAADGERDPSASAARSSTEEAADDADPTTEISVDPAWTSDVDSVTGEDVDLPVDPADGTLSWTSEDFNSSDPPVDSDVGTLSWTSEDVNVNFLDIDWELMEDDPPAPEVRTTDSPTTDPPTTWEPTTPAPTFAFAPVPAPARNPTTKGLFRPISYGQLLYHDALDIQVSKGLSVRLVAASGRKVPYKDGRESSDDFHWYMDGAGIVPLSDGGYVYVSNSENSDPGQGGVYGLYFDSQGQIVDYKPLLLGTTKNCGGGLSPWKTWISCEEYGGTQCWQVDPDPWNEHHWNPRATLLGGEEGGKFESVAVDNTTPDAPVFFTTEDDWNGALRRFTADGKGWSALHEGGSMTYLKIIDDVNFEWTEKKWAGMQSAKLHFPNSEGISYADKKLYFVSKVLYTLFVLDLKTMTYTKERTGGENLSGRGAFNAQPDQVMVGPRKRYLYLAEDDGSSPGVFVRDLQSDGAYYTVFQAVPGGRYDEDETAGIALTPDRMRLYAGFQDAGLLIEFTRDDGYAFE